MKSIAQRYRLHFGSRVFVVSLVASLLILGASIVINFYAGIYATERASNAVTDIILSNTRVFDVDGLFVYGAIGFWVFVLLLCLRHPQRIPFIAKNIALFVLVRSLFISLTHIGPYPTHIAIDSETV